MTKVGGGIGEVLSGWDHTDSKLHGQDDVFLDRLSQD